MKTLLYSFILFYTFASFAQDKSFAPLPSKEYVLVGWVQDASAPSAENYEGHVKVLMTDTNGTQTIDIYPSGTIIDGWQRIEGTFEVLSALETLELKLVSKTGATSYFDDIRVFPVNGNMKSFVYDPKTQRLMAELDENNYATFYEYDKEGGLVRVKKETVRGIQTIQETRSSTSKINQ